MLVVVSLDSSALLAPGEHTDAATQRMHVRLVAEALAPLAREHDLVICHDNIAQLGTLALESENDDTLRRPYPLDVLGAQTQGMIGYWIVQALRQAGVTRPAVVMITHTVIDAHDEGFRRPSAFIGPGYTRDQVQLWAGELGWQLALDGDTWRRVVPALTPVAVRELAAIRAVVDTGTIVVCGGGGGVPVCDEGWADEGIDAVVDPDHTAALLAAHLNADRLLFLTKLDLDPSTGPGLASGSVSAERAAARAVTKSAAAKRFADATGKPVTIATFDRVAEVIYA